MSNSFKRFLSLAMAIIMVIGMMPTNVVFATETEGEHTHAWVETTVEATCDADGSITKACECGVTEITTIPAAGHSYDTETGVCTCGATAPTEAVEAVAEDGGVKSHDELAAALKADGEVKLGDEVTFEGGSVQADIVLDLAGKTLKITSTLTVEKDRTLTIKDSVGGGAVNLTNANICNEGTLNITGGAFTNTNGGNVVRTEGGTTTISGGTFTTGGIALYTKSNGTATISNATISATTPIYAESSSLTVNSGSFTTSADKVVELGSTVTVNITGGTFANTKEQNGYIIWGNQNVAGTVNISGGAFSGTGALFAANGGDQHKWSVSISGGNFNCAKFSRFSNENANYAITGGTFTGGIENTIDSSYIPTDYELVNGSVKKKCEHTNTTTTSTATCTDAGVKTVTCADCGATVSTEDVDALGHSFSADAQYCKNNCGTENEGYVAPHEHSWENGYCAGCDTTCGHADVVPSGSQAPTCDVDGYTAMDCSTCGHHIVVVEEATGHDYVDGTCSVCGAADPSAKTYVAEVGGVQYETLQAAIDAADGKTVKLLADVTYTTVYADNKTHWNGDLNYELSVGKDVVLDLNGYTIKTTGGSSYSYYALICVRSGSLTVQDSSEAETGAIICSAETAAKSAYTIYNNGALTLNGGTVSNTIGNYAIESVTVGETALTINEGATVTSTGIAVRVCSQGSTGTQTVAINGGTISGTYAMWVPVKNGGSDVIDLTISGGTLTGSSNAVLFNTYTNGDATTDSIKITGGEFNGNVLIGAQYSDDENNVALSAALAGKVISGGTFANDVSDYCANGYEIEDNGDGTYGVAVAKNIEVTDAEGNVTNYAGFDGFKNLNLENCTIKLLNNVSDANLILNKDDKNVVLDLNGFAFRRAGSSSGAINLTLGAELTIKDSSEAKTGKIVADNNAIWIMSGAVVVEGGTVETTSSSKATVWANAAELTIKGGKIVAAGDAILVGENFMESRGTSTVMVSGGEIEAAGKGIVSGSYSQAATAVSVSGGKIESVGDSISMTTGTVAVSGGTFSSDVSDYVVDGFEVKQNADGSFGVTAPVPVAMIGEKSYTSLEAAFAAAVDGDTITLLADVALSSHLIVPAQMTLTIDGNGHKITPAQDFKADANGAVLVLAANDTAYKANSNYTVKNLTFEGFNGLTRVVRANFSNALIENCSFNGNAVSEGVITSAYAQLSVKDCVFNGNTSGFSVVNVGSDVSSDTALVANITGSSFTGNSAAIAAVYLATSANVTGNEFKDNVHTGNNANGAAILAGPYEGTCEYTINITNNAFVNAMGEKPAVFAEDWSADYGVKTAFDLSSNYWNGKDPTKVEVYKTSGANPDVTLKNYYTEVEADGTLSELVRIPIYVAEVNGVKFESLTEAAAAAKVGDEIILLRDVTEDVTVPAGVIFNGNGKKVGNIIANGDITFKGHTKAVNFGTKYTKTTINIGEGACLEITGTGRLVVGHGCTFNITGTIADAKTADKAAIQPSLITPGASITGAGVTFNVTNAYIKNASSYWSSSKSASGTFDFNIENSVWENVGKLAFESQSTAATVNFELKDSVLTTTSHLVFGVSKGEIVFDNSNVNVGTSRQIENQSTMTVKNGSVVNGAVATSSNAKNPGTLIVDNATYSVTGEFSGSDLGTGTLIVKNGASVTMGSVTKANIVIDATGMAAGDDVNLTANLSKLAGTVEVINNGTLEAKIVDGKVVLAERELNGVGTAEDPYQIATKDDMFLFAKKVNDGTYKNVHVVLTADIDLVQEDWTSIGTSANPFTGTFDGNGKTISNIWSYERGLFGFTSTGNYVDSGSNGRATIKNLTLNGVEVYNQSTSAVGGLVGQAKQNTEITDVTVTGYISIYGYGYVGGLVGQGYVHVDDCHVVGVDSEDGDKSTIDASYWAVGGIVGHAGSEGGASITNCSVKNVIIHSAIYGAGAIAGVGTSGPIENVSAESVAVKAESTPDANGLLVGCNYERITGESTVKDVVLTVDNVVVTAPQDMVASINGSYYVSLQAAIDAAGEGETVKVLNDITLTENVKVSTDDVIVLDLNGKTVSMNQTETVTANHEMIHNLGNLTIQDSSTEGTGKISYAYTGANLGTSYAANAIATEPGSVLTVKSGTIENLTYDCATIAYAIDGLTNGSAGDVTVNIEGGTITSERQAVRIFANSTTNVGTLNITGGDITGRVIVQNASAKANKAALNITGGTFNANDYKTDVLYVGGSNSATIDMNASVSGGTFKGEITDTNVTGFITGGSFKVAPADDLLAEGYEVTYDNKNKTFGVEAKVVATVGGQDFTVLADAIEAAKNGGTIFLKSNVVLKKTLTIPADAKITLDLNGKVIDGTGNVRIALMSYGDLTVKDSSKDQDGVIKAGIGTAGNAVNICAGSFTMESGSIYSLNNAILVDEQAATITIKGGSITAEPATKNSAVMYVSSKEATVINITGGTMVGQNGLLLWNKNEVNISGGSIEGTALTAIQGNGTWDETVINISGDAIITGKTTAIYHPQNGELNISGNAVLTGETGVVIKSGKVNISGGTINGTGEAKAYEPKSSGFNGTGDALYVEHYDNSANSENYSTPVVTVTGGTFTSANGKAVASYANPNNNVEALDEFISGGSFSSDVSDLCAQGFVAEKNTDGTYGVVKDAYAIFDLADLKVFRDAVNAGNTYSGKTVKLYADIDLAGEEWTPIGSDKSHAFKGTFDGQNHTISNLKINDADLAYAGLFGYAENAKINNVKLHNVDIHAYSHVGAVAGIVYTGSVDNCHVSGSIKLVAQYAYAAGITGYGYVTVSNSSVIADGTGTITVVEKTGAGGITGWRGEGKTGIYNCTVKNLNISAWSNVGAITGFVHYDNTIDGCTVENVNLVKTRVDGQAAIGLAAGGWSNKASGSYAITITNNSFSNVTMQGTAINSHNQLIGSNYSYYDVVPKLTASGNSETEVSADVKVVVNKEADLEKALAYSNSGETIYVGSGFETSKSFTVPAGKSYTLDLAGHTIAGTDTTTKNYGLINNNGTLTVNDSVGGGKMTVTATTDSGTSRYSAVISNNPGGTLVVDGGTIEHLGGTYMAYGIDSLTNGGIGDVSVTINGGTVKSTYRGIRQFLNSDSKQNVLTINGGTIVGVNKSVFFHDPSTKANNGTLTVGENATLKGDVYLFVTAGSTEWPVEVAIVADALADGSKVTSGNVPEQYVVENVNGTYGKVTNPAYGAVAQIGDTYYATLADALAAAKNGDTIQLLWTEGDAPIAMNGAVYGKSVTITGTATVDWSKNFLFIGRGGEGDGTVIFEGANLTSASNSASYGIHVSGREKNTNNKYDGTLVINNSTIELDYLINKGAMTLDNSILTVKNGFSIGGRPASETETGVDATATLNLTNGSKVVVNNHNGMGLGYEAIGVMNIDATSTFETTQSFLVTAKGTMNIAGTAKIAGTLTNNGKIVLTDVAATLTSSECGNVTTDVGDYVVTYADGAYKLTERQPDGEIAYRAYIEDSANREAVKVDLQNIYAKESVVVKLYDANGNLLTTTSLKAGAAEGKYLTTNIVLSGTPSGSWDTVISAKLTVANVPSKGELWIDGTLLDTFENILGKSTDAAAYQLPAYLALDCVYKEAKIGDTYYATLEEAFKAATSGCTIDILADITISEAWDNRYTGAKFTVPVTINGNGHTIKFTNTVYDGGNYMSAFRFEADATVKNLTVDMSEALSGFAGRFRAISAKADLTVDKCTFIGNGSANNTRAIIFGEGAGTAIAEQDVTITNSTFTGWRRGVSDNENAQDAKTVTVTGNTFTDASVAVSASESVTFTGNTVADGSTVSITSYTDLVDVTATGNTMTANEKTFVSKAVSYDNIQAEFAVVAAASVTSGQTVTYFNSFAEAYAAANAGDTIELLADVELDGTLTVGKAITINGNGNTITTSAEFVGNASNAMIDIQKNITFNNVVFNGVKGVAVMRAVSADVVIDNCVVQNCEQTVAQGLFRLACGNATITDSQFLNNDCTMVVSFGYDAANDTDVLVVDGCTFESNTCGETAVVYFADGDYGKITNTKFVDNAVSSTGNAATLYMGWGDGFEVSGCTFEGNEVTTSHATTKRFASAIFCDGCTVNGNVFVDNTATRNGETITTAVAVGAYYGAADVGENYWGGEAPVPGVDYTIEYTNNKVAVEDYYAEYDAESGLAELTNIPAVARVGKYSYATLADAVAAAQDGETVKIQADIALNESVSVAKKITLDLAGHTIAGTDTTTKNFGLINIQPGAELTVEDSVGDGKITLIATNDRDFNAYSSVISNQRGKLTVNGGIIEHLGGTDMAYGIDNLTNGKGTYAETVIKAGAVKSTYRAIRQFLNGVEAQNILTVNGGTIEGANKSIWMQDPNKNANSGKLTVGENATLKGDVYLFVTAGSTEWPVEVAIAADALADGSEVVTGNVPAGLAVKNVNGTYGIVRVLAGSGTEADPYQINNLEDLIFFRDSVNKGETTYNAPGVYVALGADIDMAGIDWSVNICDDCNATFDGIFDGNNKTIKNLTSTETAQKGDGYICTGLFGAIYGEAVVKNLTIENVNINTGDFTGNNVGAVVGFAYAATGSIENVKVIGDIQINAKNVTGVGAIVGYDYYGDLTVKNCSVIGNDGSTITGAAYVGGVIGYASNKADLIGNTVENVDIYATSCAAGGIAGIMLAGASASDNTVKNVVLDAAHANWKNSTAAVVGTITNGSVTISGTTVENVTANGAAAGIVGCIHAEKPTAPVGKVEARIGDVYYTTLEAALAVATADDEIILLAPVTVEAGETLVIDKAVSYTSDVLGEAMITNNGDLTIAEGGKIVYTYTGAPDSAYGKGNYTINNYGKLTVEGGTVENATAAMKHAFYTIQNGNNGEVIINSGKVLNTNNYAIRQFASGNATNTVTVNGGEVIGTRAVWMQAAGSDANNAPTIALTVNGGKLTGTGETGYKLAVYSYSYGDSLKNVSVTVNGGEIDGDIALTGGSNKTVAETVTITGGKITDVYSYAAEEVAVPAISITGGIFEKADAEMYALDNGYEFVENYDGTYSVVELPDVAEVNGTGFKTLAEAFAAAQNGETVILLADIETSETITIEDGKVVTLDLNGKKITATDNKASGNYELFYNFGELTVKNGTIELTATTDRAYNAASSIFHNRGGVLNIESGNYIHNGGTSMAYVVDNSANSYGDATTNITGGTLTSAYIGIRNRMDTYGANGNPGNGVAILNITGGAVNGKYAVWGQVSSAGCKGNITITGGTFTAWEGKDAVLVDTDSTGEIVTAISGGTYTSDVTKYCVEGYECVTDGAGKYVVVAHHDHPVIIETETVEATCSAKGSMTITVYCETCEAELETSTVELEKLAHEVVVTYTDYVDATCEATGSKTMVVSCKNCDELIYKEVLTIAKLDHTVVIDEAVAPTLTSTGLTAGAHCSACDTVLVKQEVVDKLTAAAKIGETEYATLQEAVNAATEGATIELLKDGEIAVVNKKLTINRNGKSATVAAAAGLTVDETTDPTKYAVVEASSAGGGEAETPETQEGVAYVVGAETEILPLQEALNNAAANGGGEVRLVKDNVVIDGTVIIPSGVTLNIESYNLTADYVIGLNGSELWGNAAAAGADPGELHVPEKNIILSEKPYYDGSLYYLPIWDNDQGFFLFTRAGILTNNAKRGLFVYEDEERIYFQFKHSATGAVNQSLFKDGLSDNAMDVIIRIEWSTNNGVAYQEFVYNDEQIGKVTGSNDYTFTLTGYSAMNIKLDTLVITAMVTSDSGAIAYGDSWKYSQDKEQ